LDPARRSPGRGRSAAHRRSREPGRGRPGRRCVRRDATVALPSGGGVPRPARPPAASPGRRGPPQAGRDTARRAAAVSGPGRRGWPTPQSAASGSELSGRPPVSQPRARATARGCASQAAKPRRPGAAGGRASPRWWPGSRGGSLRPWPVRTSCPGHRVSASRRHRPRQAWPVGHGSRALRRGARAAPARAAPGRQGGSHGAAPWPRRCQSRQRAVGDV
jgi:hypothetical protein